MSAWKEFSKGIIKENPITVCLLGMCPALAISTSTYNALGMGVSVIFVLLCSNLIISLIKKVIPKNVRIPCFIVVIATFVTIVDLVIHAFQPALHKSLGIFIPLIVVNCIILGRAEAFASKRPVFDSIFDGLGMGIGFTLVLAIVATFREILGNGTITIFQLGDTIVQFRGLETQMAKTIVMILPPGGFIGLGIFTAVINKLRR
jgi:electron transport complex protein RnfE